MFAVMHLVCYVHLPTEFKFYSDNKVSKYVIEHI